MNPAEVLFPDAYRRGQVPGRPQTLPDLRRWRRAALLAAALVALLSWPVWEAATAVARAPLERVLRLLDR
jgi:hypothetical protein